MAFVRPLAQEIYLYGLFLEAHKSGFLLSKNRTGTPPTGKTTALLQADVKTCNHNTMEQSKHREIQKIKNHLSHAQKNLIL